MTCPICNRLSTIWRTVPEPDALCRHYVCDANHRFSTRETVVGKPAVDRRTVNRMLDGVEKYVAEIRAAVGS